MKSENTYEFYGVDAKTEWRIGAIVGFCIILMMAISFILVEGFIKFKHDIWRIVFLAIVGSGVAGGISLILSRVVVIMEFLGKKYRKLWQLQKSGTMIEIKYNGLTNEIFLEDIIKVKIYGNLEFKYFTIKTQTKTVKIRVGNSGLTPFSRDGDVRILDSFIDTLKPYLNKNFAKKDKKFYMPNNVKLIYTRK